MIIRTPAKINIGLNVIKKREDEYHDIETLFYPINLFDEITINDSEKFQFRSSLSVLEQENNLIIRAVRLLENETSHIFNIEIYLQKNIPIGAGLGGGSSDAAAILLSLNQMFELNIKILRLKELALQLGSDVPFFLNPVPSFAGSRGEILEPVNFKIPFPVLIVNPGIHIPTRMAFEKVVPLEPAFNLKKVLLGSVDFSSLKNFVTNDFENIIFEMYPETGEIKSRLYYTGALFALMTGTGSSIFGIYPELESAQKAEKNFSQNYFTHISL